MRPLKGIVERLVPLARVWFAAIAFDPFRGRRLSLLYRIVEPAGPHDLATSLAAARPVTTSALLAQWLLAVGLPFSDDEARDGVMRLRDALPRGAFVDPELTREPQACIDEALARMTRRELLVADGGRRRLGERRGDARFPGVTDIVAFQATFLGETVEALRRLGESRPADRAAPGLRVEPS
jgi:hypothetical protein